MSNEMLHELAKASENILATIKEQPLSAIHQVQAAVGAVVHFADDRKVMREMKQYYRQCLAAREKG